MPRATLTWRGQRRFDAEVGGHHLLIDGNQDGPADGPTPMQLLLPAIAACSGIDVAAILEKKHLELTALTITIDGVRRESPFPKVYTAIEVLYTVRGRGVPAKAVEDAIRLSRDRYCSVTAMIAGPRFTWRYRVEDEDGGATAEGIVA